jgi:uncharacterized damage-inducible protein DinB
MKKRGTVPAGRVIERPHSTRRVNSRRESKGREGTPPEDTPLESTRLEQAKTDLGRSAVQIFAANERMNQVLIERLDPAAWRAKPPGKVRSIAAIFTHVHNVRTKWVRLTAPHLKVPRQLDRSQCTPEQASAGLAESAARCEEMLAEALGMRAEEGVKSGDIPPFSRPRMGHPVSAVPVSPVPGRRVEMFLRDGWARPWPVGVEMLCYMLAHEAHHRGQVCMLAHQLGFPLPLVVTSGLWNWEKLWKECGAPGGPGL